MASRDSISARGSAGEGKQSDTSRYQKWQVSDDKPEAENSADDATGSNRHAAQSNAPRATGRDVRVESHH